ncbi:hypothetical protein Peur_032806 [Populus x canadensis]
MDKERKWVRIFRFLTATVGKVTSSHIHFSFDPRWNIHNLAKQISQVGRFGSDRWVGFVTWKLLSSITLPSGPYDLALTYTEVTILWSHFFLFSFLFSFDIYAVPGWFGSQFHHPQLLWCWLKW